MDFLSEFIKIDSDIEHEVFVLRASQERKHRLLKLGVKSYFPKNNNYNLLRRLKIIKLVFEGKYNIVHGQNYSGNLWASIGAFFQFRKISLISHEHGGAWGAKGLHKIVSWFWAKNSKVVICNSNAAEKIIKGKISKKAFTKVIYNGVAKANIEVHEKNLIGGFKILFVGRLEEVKGIRELALALKNLDDRKVSFICNILGDGELRGWLDQYLRANNLKSKVFLHGVVGNVHQFMADSDVLILPSLREPLGNVIIEAAHHKLPVIASGVDGIPEIVRHCETGVLLTPKVICSSIKLPEHVVSDSGELVPPMAINSYELASEIIRLIDYPEIRKEYGLKAKQMLESFTISRYTCSIRNLYLNLDDMI
jgi:glycosyltransferase involved in cell wall biosynthesis